MRRGNPPYQHERVMFAFLNIKTGPEKGRQCRLDPTRPVHIGRGSGCEIMLTDPLSSRFHAVVYFDDNNWHVRDTSSRNGTLVNGQKIDQARLLDESIITIGGTDLVLDEINTVESDDADFSQTLIIDPAIANDSTWTQEDDPLAKLAETGYVLDLYQLSLELLSQSTGEDVLQTVLELLMVRTSASSVCLYHEGDDGKLLIRSCHPSDWANKVHVSRKLTRRLCKQNKAHWIGKDDDQSLRGEVTLEGETPWSDIILSPLTQGDRRIGMLQLFQESTPFKQQDFDFVVAASSLLAIGMINGQQHDSLVAERSHYADRNAETSELIGASPVMTKLQERIGRVARASGSVLIRGESGSGKELVARAVHHASPRVDRPMLTVNCAAIPHDLIESQLFGHKKGSFTGADADHTGWFQQAHTGTLFLDEIGELTLEGQAKLLRILEGHPFLPVGATEQVLVDVRVIAATNRDLAEFVREKKFREDLFYRLSVFELMVPPLREREDDINLLIEHFMAHFCRQHGRSSLTLSDEARFQLHNYAWPGNVRQLRNVIDSAVVMADDPEIQAADLGLRDAGISRLDTLRIDAWEKRLIQQALTKTGGSVPAAAKLLGISRATAYRKLTEYEIPR